MDIVVVSQNCFSLICTRKVLDSTKLKRRDITKIESFWLMEFIYMIGRSK